MSSQNYDVIILGAGGAGLMCAMEAGKRGRKVLVLDHADKVGKKILISGGGRCNFTNVEAAAEKYQSENQHFAKSAFSQFTQFDFIQMVEKHNIAYHEKKLGQQFCDQSAQQIVDMLLAECADVNADIHLNCTIESAIKTDEMFLVETSLGNFNSESLVVATGGLSIPKMGATSFGYKIAEQFELPVVNIAPALVPFTFNPKDLELYDGLSGISFDAKVTCGKVSFREKVLMTHRGASGPAILQISSYWQPGQEIIIQMLPDLDWAEFLTKKKSSAHKQALKTVLAEVLPSRLVQRLWERNIIPQKVMAEISKADIAALVKLFTHFTIKPNGTEGYRKAEVTLGGVKTDVLHARTLEVKSVPNLFFIGEVVDVTGWLGGYNFQWAWSSGFAAGQVA